ncbi:MAG: CBS domain-containing protein [Bdellovibrionales bacterium]|nr:CBS domain-containing protein [Bdellovibrionales bacterium]
MNTTQNIMSTDVTTIRNDDSIINAYRIMKEKDIRHLPVIDSNRKVVGMLSDRDVQKAMVTKKLDEFYNEVQIPSEYTVANFMNWPVCTVGDKTSIKHLAEIMIKEKISSLVVESEAGRIEGIVTTTDLLAYLMQSLDEKAHSHWTQWTLAYYLKDKKRP